MTNDETDQLARDLPNLTMHGPIPTGTTHAFAARLVELLDQVTVLKREKNHEALQRDMAREQRRTAEARVAKLESIDLARRLPKVWELKIAGRSIVLRYENGAMSAVATLQSDDDVTEEFELDRIDQRGESTDGT